MLWIPSEIYKEILRHVPIACVDIAIVSEGRILLVERMDEPAKGQMWLPGGRVRKGETMRDAAARKAIEEVGIECHVGPIVHTAETIFDDGPHGVPVHSINTCFFLFPRLPGARVHLDDHHARSAWVEGIDGDLHPYVRRCLLAAGLQRLTASGSPVLGGEGQGR